MFKLNRHLSQEQGFTLLELLVTVAIVGTLSAIAIPTFSNYRDKARVSKVASELRSFESAFYVYYADHKEWPEDSHRTVPDGMEDLINQSHWDRETALGGYYNYEGPESYGYAGLSIFSHSASNDLIELLDKMLDNGDLSSGRFRTGSNGRPTLIIEE